MERIFDYAKIAVIAFIGVWLINRGLKAMGLAKYSTDGAPSASAT